MTPLLNEFLDKMHAHLPDLVDTKDLIKIGLYKSHSAAQYARDNQLGPPFFQIGKRVVYMRDGIIEWLKANARDTDIHKI